MWPVATDGVAWSVGRSVCRSVCLVTTMSPAEVAELIVCYSGCALGWAKGTMC